MFKEAREERKIKEAEKRAHEYTKKEGTLGAGLKEEYVDIRNANTMNSDIVLFTQDFEDEKCESLIHELKNHVRDSKGNWVVPKELLGYTKEGEAVYQDMQPKINDAGIMMILTLARPFFHRNMINSNYDDTKINFILKKTKRVLRRSLIVNSENYGLTNEPSTTVLSEIIDCVMNHVKPTIYRALNDGERRHLRSFTKKIEATTDGTQQPKKRWTW